MKSIDKWLVDYERIEQEVREVRETLVKRWQTNVGTAEHALLTNRLRNSIPQAEKAVGNLLARIDDWELRNLTEREKERRIRLCETLQSSIKRVAMDFNDGRSSGATAHTSDCGWGVEEESVNTEGLTVEQIRERNRLVEQQQEAGLDVLSQVISRQKRIASAIGTEVDDQNDLLDEISERTTNTQNRLIDETDHIGIVQKKIRTWPYWLVIILLFIAIVIVAVW
ncbi:syntaxin-8-like [Macrobrachium nipponense]|uniref:syntaxin-8-like n=1 Tax=Macrobrachium nipponense TaxID=159736 RepID=UPI0030C85863